MPDELDPLKSRIQADIRQCRERMEKDELRLGIRDYREESAICTFDATLLYHRHHTLSIQRPGTQPTQSKTYRHFITLIISTQIQMQY